jgi:hypothetical protein
MDDAVLAAGVDVEPVRSRSSRLERAAKPEGRISGEVAQSSEAGSVIRGQRRLRM